MKLPVKQTFKINGYWKNSKGGFENYLVRNTSFDDDKDDDEIFGYEMPENFIKRCIEDGTDSVLDYVITAYALHVNSVEEGIELGREVGINFISQTGKPKLVRKVFDSVEGFNKYIKTMNHYGWKDIGTHVQ